MGGGGYWARNLQCSAEGHIKDGLFQTHTRMVGAAGDAFANRLEEGVLEYHRDYLEFEGGGILCRWHNSVRV